MDLAIHEKWSKWPKYSYFPYKNIRKIKLGFSGEISPTEKVTDLPRLEKWSKWPKYSNLISLRGGGIKPTVISTLEVATT